MTLPEPYYEAHGITIYHGRCEDVLPHIPQSDPLLTDPPYGINISANSFRQKFDKSDWDAAPVDGELLSTCIASARRAIVWGGNYFALPAHQRFLIWDKGQPEKFSSAMCELAWTNLGGPAKLFRRHVVSYVKHHPTQKPVELMRWCIEMAGNVESVVDPFMGSGTTLRACMDMGIPAVGIEMDERYCEAAVKRLAQLSMFGERIK